LQLTNAQYKLADGGKLPFDDSTFDASVCSDVFINLPSVEEGAPIIREMLRVTKPGGHCVIGSVPDSARQSDLPSRIAQVSTELDSRFGPLKARPAVNQGKLRNIAARWLPVPQPSVTCFYFSKNDFIEIGKRLNADAVITDVHALNPYFGFRFDVIYTKHK
jgi:ubiquinone/menaquinone biosynthesis C-methylase UbiE